MTDLRGIDKIKELPKMTELEELIAQRKELDKKIRALQNPKYEVDGARMFKRAYNGKPLSVWTITVEEIYDLDSDKAWQWKQIVNAKTKEDAISGLNNIILALSRLYRQITEEE